ncbi:MAG TPA: catalase [Ilumatobacter sp.]|nr:catalase [Ilumatobacter sp.]
MPKSPARKRTTPKTKASTGKATSKTGSLKKTAGGAGAPGDHAGNAGELHQVASGGRARLTTQQGIPVSDDQNSLRVGQRGPTTLDDFVMREKIFHFDHERIPERVVHARGYGAHGFFETYEPLTDLTSADLLQRAGEQTPAFVRFSTVAGSKGSFDLARDVRGFAVKLYTQEGNWDIVGNNIPVFFIQDAIKFPDLVHSVKEEPDRGFPQAQSAHDNFWDFASLMPETTHMLMWQMSDRAIPRSFRFMQGFGVHTFRLVNAAGKATFVKFHWTPKLGMQSVLWNEAVKINGADPDFHRRDLWDSIQAGDFPEWELGIQAFDDEFADQFDFDVLDATKLIPEELVPVRPIGRLVLNRVVDNFFAETEQVAFCTANVVPGVDFTNDPLLQGRNFSYLDTQLKRLGGPNFTHLPVNAPKCPVAHFQQDGHMAMQNPIGRVNYEPNSRTGTMSGPREDPDGGFQTTIRPESGDTRRVRSETFADHYSQARQFFLSQTAVEQGHIVDSFVFELSKVEEPAIRERMVANLRNVHEPMAAAIAQGLGLAAVPTATQAASNPVDLPVSPPLSILSNPPGTFAGRKLGVLVTDDTDAAVLASLKAAVKAAGATMELIAPTIGGITASDGKVHPAKQKIDGGPSVLYDAIAVIPSANGAAWLAQHAPALDFVRDAHAHCKFVARTESSDALFDAAGLSDQFDDGYLPLTKKRGSADSFLATCAALRFWEREPATRWSIPIG